MSGRDYTDDELHFPTKSERVQQEAYDAARAQRDEILASIKADVERLQEYAHTVDQSFGMEGVNFAYDLCASDYADLTSETVDLIRRITGED